VAKVCEIRFQVKISSQCKRKKAIFGYNLVFLPKRKVCIMKSQYHTSASRSSRRSLLKGTVAGVAGIAATSGLIGGGLYLSSKQGSAGAAGIGDSGVTPKQTQNNKNNAMAIQNILNIAVTAEMLGVTFYKRVLAHADRFDFSRNARLDLEAALIEEQIHQKFLMQQGAKSLTHMFSFPFGERTFREFDAFFQTQQLLEATFVAAYLAATKEFTLMGRADLAQIASQIGGVEAEHRAIGRAIGGLAPANNRAFEQLLLKRVADAPAVLTNAGFLTPSNSNSYGYGDTSTSMDGVEMLTPWS